MIYITKNLRSLLTQLHSLTPLELEKVQAEINSITVRKIPNFIPYEPQGKFPQSYAWDSSSLHLSNRPVSSSTNDTLDNDLKVKESVKESVTKPPRPLGIWKGQVEISEDFYKTSNDILSELGIEE